MNKNMFLLNLAVFLLLGWILFFIVKRMTDMILQVPDEQHARAHSRPLSAGLVTMVRASNSQHNWYPWHSFRGQQNMKWQSNSIFSLQKMGK